MSEPLLGNYVVLKEDTPKNLRFRDHQIVPKLIVDPMTHTPKQINALQFYVEEEDGRRVDKIYSITSEKHAQQFAPFLEGYKYRGKLFTITIRGKGFLREYTVAVS
mgnify:CR=1 FL=1